MKTYFLFTFSIIVLFFSCKKDESQQNNTPIIPIKTGNSWTTIDSNFQVENGKSLKITYTVTIGDSIQINGQKGFKKYYSAKKDHAFIINNDSEGNLISIGGISNTDTLTTKPSIMYKKKAKKDESWISEILSYDSKTFKSFNLTTKLTKTDTIIKTKIGDFKCNVYMDTSYSAEINYHYISIGTGEIKYEKFKNGILVYNKTLTSYILK